MKADVLKSPKLDGSNASIFPSAEPFLYSLMRAIRLVGITVQVRNWPNRGRLLKELSKLHEAMQLRESGPGCVPDCLLLPRWLDRSDIIVAA